MLTTLEKEIMKFIYDEIGFKHGGLHTSDLLDIIAQKKGLSKREGQGYLLSLKNKGYILTGQDEDVTFISDSAKEYFVKQFMD